MKPSRGIVLCGVIVASTGCPRSDWDVTPPYDPSACDRECLPRGPSGWSETPVYLWTGPLDKRPSCEVLKLSEKDFGFTFAIASNVCPLCTCDPPTGSCELSPSFTAGTTSTCPPGGSTISFDAPDGWDGSCDKYNPLPGGLGIHSWEVAPVKLVLEGCTPHASTTPIDENAIKFTAAVTCGGN